MKKFIAAAAVLCLTVAGLQAAPTLGVMWRAAANVNGKPKLPGVKILSVDAGSNAEELGLEVGDTVVAINNKVVRTGAEATAAVQAANGQLTLLVKDSRGRDVEITATIDGPANGFAGAKGGNVG